MGNPQPSDELLNKISEIASMKRELSRMERAATSRAGLYVWADELPDGRTLVRAGSRSVFAKLIFFVHPDGRKEVKKYQPGEWETRADGTLALTQAVVRAANWTLPPSKRDAFFADETVDQDDPRWQEARNARDKVAAEHGADIDVFHEKQRDRKTGLDLLATFVGFLQEEWPVTYLETAWNPKLIRLVWETVVGMVNASYGLGYCVGRGWLSPEHLDYALIDIADGVARLVRVTSGNRQARRYPWVEAYRKVAELGIAAAGAEEEPEVSARPGRQATSTASDGQAYEHKARSKQRPLDQRWKTRLREKKRRPSP